METKTESTWTRALGGLEHALARAADGAFAMAPNGRIILWNRAAEEILGYADREALGRRCCSLLLAWDDRGRPLDCRGCHVMTLARNGSPVPSFDAQVKHKAGRRVRINFSTLVVTNGGRADEPVTVHLFHDAMSPGDGPRPAPGAEGSPAPPLARLLTPREIEIVRLLATGITSRVAAERLKVSTATVRNHVQHILAKLGAHSRVEVVAHVLRHRLL